MKSRDVVGRTIVGVEHGRALDTYGQDVVHVVTAVVLDNGTKLIPHGFDSDGDPEFAATILHLKKRRKKR